MNNNDNTYTIDAPGIYRLEDDLHGNLDVTCKGVVFDGQGFTVYGWVHIGIPSKHIPSTNSTSKNVKVIDEVSEDTLRELEGYEIKVGNFKVDIPEKIQKTHTFYSVGSCTHCYNGVTNYDENLEEKFKRSHVCLHTEGMRVLLHEVHIISPVSGFIRTIDSKVKYDISNITDAD
jgi:hypothetical protein